MQRVIFTVVTALIGLTLLAPIPRASAEPDGLAVTGWALDSASPALVRRNADGMSTLSIAGVSIRPRLLSSRGRIDAVASRLASYVATGR